MTLFWAFLCIFKSVLVYKVMLLTVQCLMDTRQICYQVQRRYDMVNSCALSVILGLSLRLYLGITPRTREFRYRSVPYFHFTYQVLDSGEGALIRGGVQQGEYSEFLYFILKVLLFCIRLSLVGLGLWKSLKSSKC